MQSYESNSQKFRTLTVLLAAATLFHAKAADVEWHPVTNYLPVVEFSVSPEEPTITNLIRFIAPTDGSVYPNSCVASISNGDPAIAVDPDTQTVTVVFSPPRTNMFCPLTFAPTSGVDGHIGPLKSGKWVFNISTNSYSFSVTEVQLPLSIQALTKSSLRLSWPASGDSFALEFNDSLYSANWQPVTNALVTSTNQNVVRTLIGSGQRFYRLRRVLP